jgi:PTS system cellobiose-specific IIB component
MLPKGAVKEEIVMVVFTLLCSLGMSTSMLVDNMADVAKAKGIEIDILALGFNSAERRLETTDVLLLGPQIKFQLPKFREKYAGKIPVIDTIDLRDYGLVNGEKILNDNLAALAAAKQ